MIHDIRAQVPKPRRGARFLFLKDPFEHVFNGNWATVFIVQLLYRDPSGDVDRLRTMANKPDADAVARYDYVFTAENDTAVLMKPSRTMGGK
ncbi:MAG: hypothetical protein U0Q18_16040 [Bryobacteraceae bacterium]